MRCDDAAVVCSPANVEVPTLVDESEISGVVLAVLEPRAGRRYVVTVGRGGGPHDDLSLLAGPSLCPAIAHDSDMYAGQRPSRGVEQLRVRQAVFGSRQHADYPRLAGPVRVRQHRTGALQQP